MKEEKIYLVEFNLYTIGRHAVYDSEGNYLPIPFGGLLIKESEFEKYKNYGHGFQSIKLVGSLYIEE